jgi:bacterioferritin
MNTAVKERPTRLVLDQRAIDAAASKSLDEGATTSSSC